LGQPEEGKVEETFAEELSSESENLKTDEEIEVSWSRSWSANSRTRQPSKPKKKEHDPEDSNSFSS